MTWDELDVGSGPPEEPCAQVGREGYAEQAKVECRQWIAALKLKLGEPPEGCELRLKSNPHDYGVYYSVVAKYDPAVEAAVNYAFDCEEKGPMTWAEVGLSAPVVRGRGR